MLRPEDFVEYRVLRLADQLQRRFARALAPLGLTPRQFSVLAVLAEAPDALPAEVARRVLTTPQSTGALLDQLEAAGLLEPRPRRGRGVASPVRLSRAGHERLAEAAEAVARLDAQSREVLGASHEVLAGAVTRWSAALDD